LPKIPRSRWASAEGRWGFLKSWRDGGCREQGRGDRGPRGVGGAGRVRPGLPGCRAHGALLVPAGDGSPRPAAISVDGWRFGGSLPHQSGDGGAGSRLARVRTEQRRVPLDDLALLRPARPRVRGRGRHHSPGRGGVAVALDATKEQALQDVSLIKLFEDHRDLWKADAKSAYEFGAGFVDVVR